MCWVVVYHERLLYTYPFGWLDNRHADWLVLVCDLVRRIRSIGPVDPDPITKLRTHAYDVLSLQAPVPILTSSYDVYRVSSTMSANIVNLVSSTMSANIVHRVSSPKRCRSRKLTLSV